MPSVFCSTSPSVEALSAFSTRASLFRSGSTCTNLVSIEIAANDCLASDDNVAYGSKTDVAEPICDVCFSNRPFGVKHFQTIHPTVSMSLAGSCFSSESALRPFHHGIRRRGGTIYWTALPSVERQVQATLRTHLIHRPARDIFPPQGGARVSSYRN